VLRVFNIGAASINDLVVRFPGSTVTFGTVPAGATTSFQKVPSGVYGYAAYDFRADSIVIRQLVLDWTGEEPLDGEDFTFSLEMTPGPTGAPSLRLVAVTREK